MKGLRRGLIMARYRMKLYLDCDIGYGDLKMLLSRICDTAIYTLSIPDGLSQVKSS